MEVQCIRALQKSPLLLLEPQEVQLGSGETDSPELFLSGSLEKQKAEEPTCVLDQSQ